MTSASLVLLLLTPSTDDPRLSKIIFTPEKRAYRIWDSRHNEVVPLTQLFYQ